jgi:cytochrome oxidase assembly protein ShyY1
MTTSRGFSFDPEWRITLLSAILLPLMVALGFWQLQRASEKAELSAAWEARQQQAPVPIADLWDASAAELAYRSVRLRGHFLENEYFLLDNRILRGRFGYEVLGIMKLEAVDDLVLVNRGWIAGDPARMELPQVPLVAGEVAVAGTVYVAPGAPYLLAEQQLQPGWPKLLQAVEMDKITTALAELDAGPVFPYPVRLAQGQPGALQVDWQVVNVSPDKHRAYAAQWFTMAAVLLIFYLLRSSNIWQLLKSIGKE